MSDTPKSPEDELAGTEQPFVQHLMELRDRLVKATLAIAIAAVAVLYGIVRSRFDDQLASLLGVSPGFLPWPIIMGMIAAGALLGAVAAYASIRRTVQI